jgi:hypothetical protein
MAVYVILQFDNEEEAKDYVTQAIHTGRVFNDDPGIYETVPVKVASVVKKPSVFCQCNALGTKRAGWTRGKSFGWWVCATCSKPSEAWASTDTWSSVLGLNLLPPEVSKEMRPQGWERSKFTWEFLVPKDKNESA